MYYTLDFVLSILWVVILSIAVLFGGMLIIFEFVLYHTTENNRPLQSGDWQMRITILFDIVQELLLISGLVLNILTIHPEKSRYEWLDLASFCTLQLLFSTNV